LFGNFSGAATTKFHGDVLEETFVMMRRLA
jgi:hypothetical protein